VVMDSPGSAVYSIGAVARMLGVPPTTIRTWEERYGLIAPQRSPGGQRLFSRQQVEHLRFVKERLDAGMQPGDAHRLLAEMLEGTQSGDRPAGPRPQLLILLAERDPYAAELEEYFLQTEGYAVELAFDASETESRAKSLTPDVVIIDLLISGGEGVETCRTIKNLTGSPVLAISALEARDEAMAAGADAFLQKPLDPLQLVSTVRDLLGSSAFLRTPAAEKA
jgi:DNA-binding transcriptional MerR regulator